MQILQIFMVKFLISREIIKFSGLVHPLFLLRRYDLLKRLQRREIFGCQGQLWPQDLSTHFYLPITQLSASKLFEL